MAGLLATAVACTSDDVSQQRDADRVPVTLSYTTQPQVDTRAAASTTLNNDYIEVGNQVTVRISNTHPSDYTTGSFDEYKYTTGEGGTLILPSPAPYYPLNGTNVDILAYYPSFDGTEFTIETDQTGNANYTASDLMWAEPIINTAKSTSNKTLTFAHKMAKIVVNAEAGTQISEINSVTLKQVQPTITFNKLTGGVSGLTGTAGDVLMATGETAASVACAAVIPEQTITGTLLEIGVKKSDGTPGTATYSVPSGKLFKAGNVYTLNISVNWPEVGATTAINNWTENGTVNIHPTKVLTFNVGGAIFNMIAVKGGDYSMYWNTTQVTGSLSDYYIGQTQVTQALWKAVMGSVPDSQTNTDAQAPVARVTWIDICGGTYDKVAANSQTVAVSNSFLYKLNAAVADQLTAYGLSGMSFKLPTEAQWEYAAMGGRETHNYTYVGTSTESELGDYAWYNANSESKTHPVGQKKPNELGLYDMNGNVWEWCRDWYNSNINGGVTALGLDYCNTDSPEEMSNGHNYRVLRGGCWNYAASYCAVSYRGDDYPSGVHTLYGLRLVLQ